VLNNTRMWFVGGVWFATLAAVIASSVAMDARLSTSAMLLALGLAPAIIMRFLAAGAPSPSVAQILHSAHAEDGR